MPRVPELRGVELRGCSKPHCTSGSPLNRHHRAHQAMWLGLWSQRRRGEPRWEAFVHRYFAFEAEDCVSVCAQHHAEIHLLYDKIIEDDIRTLRKSLRQYTWREAERLMGKLEYACENWLKQVTPGMNPELLTRFRKRRAAKKRNRR